MVLAAPLFLVTQTRALGAYVAANREPFVRLGLGTTICWLALRLLSKTYETSKLADDVERATRLQRHVSAALAAPEWVASTASVVASAPAGERREAALRAATAQALASAAREADAEAQGLESTTLSISGGSSRKPASAAPTPLAAKPTANSPLSAAAPSSVKAKGLI